MDGIEFAESSGGADQCDGDLGGRPGDYLGRHRRGRAVERWRGVGLQFRRSFAMGGDNADRRSSRTQRTQRDLDRPADDYMGWKQRRRTWRRRIFTPSGNSWAAVSSTSSPAARYNHAALWTGTEMLILDGSTGSGELASGSAYNPATGLWRTLSAGGGPLARTQPGAVWTGTQAVVFGGQASSQPVAALQTLVPQPAWYFYSKL